MKYTQSSFFIAKLLFAAFIILTSPTQLTHAQNPEWKIVYNGGLQHITFTDAFNGYASGPRTIVKTTDGGYTWTQLNINNLTFFTTDIIFINSQTGFVFAEQWTFRTTDAGQSWQIFTDTQYPYKKAIFFAGGNSLWGLSGEGDIIKSTDLGETWMLKYDSSENVLMDIEFCNPLIGWAVGDPYENNSNIMKTTNGGESWFSENVPFNDYNFGLKKLSFVDENTGYCLFTSAGIGKTTDQGKTWSVIHNQNASDLATFKPNGVWASSYGLTLKSLDGGKTWINDSLDAYTYEISCVDSSLAYVTAANYGGVLYKYVSEIFIPDTSASIWKSTLMNFNETYTDLDFLNNKIGWCSAANSGNFNLGSLYKTTDGGLSWVNIYKSNETSFPSIHFISESTGFAATYGNQGSLLKTTDSGLSWGVVKENVPSGMYFHKSTGLLYGRTILITNDYGENWKQIDANLLPSVFYCNDVFFADEMTGWFCGYDISANKNYIYKTTDGGVNWVMINESYGIHRYTNICGFTNSDLLYLTSSTSFHGVTGTKTEKSTDGGLTWISFPATVGGDAIYFTSPDTGWIAWGQFSSEALISKTTDGGQTWSMELSDKNGRFRTMLFSDNQLGWVFGTGRLLTYLAPSALKEIIITKDIADTTVMQWDKLSLQISAEAYPAPRYRLIDAPALMSIDPVSGIISWGCDETGNHNIVVEVYNTYKSNRFNFIIEVKSLDISDSRNYELFQNFPNPFNQGTKIRYLIPQAGFVSLILYDIMGREVTRLINKEQSAGEFNLHLDAGNLCSGIYLYHLKSGNFSDIKKLVIVK